MVSSEEEILAQLDKEIDECQEAFEKYNKEINDALSLLERFREKIGKNN